MRVSWCKEQRGPGPGRKRSRNPNGPRGGGGTSIPAQGTGVPAGHCALTCHSPPITPISRVKEAISLFLKSLLRLPFLGWARCGFCA